MEFNTSEVAKITSLSATSDVLKEELDKILKAHSTSAVAASALDGERVLYMNAIGKTSFSDHGCDVQVDNTVFLVASITKTFLAVVCLQCAERNELDLNTDINVYLQRRNISVNNPYFPTSPITVQHLLTHRSGLDDDESALQPGSKWRNHNDDFPSTLEEYVTSRFSSNNKESVTKDSVPWYSEEEPGRCSYRYSNAGFTLLGLVVECATGLSLNTLVARGILEPLGMTHTAYALSEIRAMTDVQIANPHNSRNYTIGMLRVVT